MMNAYCGWERKKLKYIAKMQSGNAIISNDIETEGEYPVYGGGAKRGYTTKYTHNGNYILIGRQGANCGSIRKVSGKFWATEHAIVVENNRGIDYDWLIYVLQSMNLNQYSVSAAQPGLAVSTIQNLGVNCPPLPIQRKISRFINHYILGAQELIKEKEKIVLLLEEARRTTVTETITTGLHHNVQLKDSGVDWIGRIPRHWNTGRIKQEADIYPSNIDKKSVEGEAEIKLCNYVDVYYHDTITSRINFMKATAKDTQIAQFTLRSNDVLITKDSESATDIAIPAWVGEDLDGILCGCHLALIRPKSSIHGQYLYYCLESPVIREQFYSRANGVTRFGLSKGAIKNGIIPLPPLEEQRKIANELSNLSNGLTESIQNINLQIQKLKEYRQSLIYEAITGKIDINEMNLEED